MITNRFCAQWLIIGDPNNGGIMISLTSLRDVDAALMAHCGSSCRLQIRYFSGDDAAKCAHMMFAEHFALSRCTTEQSHPIKRFMAFKVTLISFQLPSELSILSKIQI